MELAANDPVSKVIADLKASTVREVATAVSTSANDVAAEASGSSVDRNSTAYKVNSNVGADIAIAATLSGGGGGGGAKAGSAMKKAGNAVKKAFNKIRDKLKNLFKKNSNKVDDAVKNTADDATAAAENAATKADSTTTSPKCSDCEKGGGKGSYTNTHESGKKYHGKGNKERSQDSGKRVEDEYQDPHVATDWTPAETNRGAFKDEATRIANDGGVENPNNYNKINSPGKKYLDQDGR